MALTIKMQKLFLDLTMCDIVMDVLVSFTASVDPLEVSYPHVAVKSKLLISQRKPFPACGFLGFPDDRSIGRTSPRPDVEGAPVRAVRHHFRPRLRCGVAAPRYVDLHRLYKQAMEQD